MNEIQIFKSDSFGAVRTTTDENGKILFCGSDVAKALGYSNVPDAISRHCRCIVKCDIPHPQSHNKTIEMSFITEGDVYRLTFGSKLPSAEKFTDWVADEILPTIRKHGAYMTENVIEQALTSPDFLIQLATQLKEEQAQRKALEQERANAPISSEQVKTIEREMRIKAIDLCGCGKVYNDVGISVLIAIEKEVCKALNAEQIEQITICNYEQAIKMCRIFKPDPLLRKEIDSSRLLIKK